MVPQPLAFGGAFDQTGNVDDGEDGGNLGLGLPHLTQFFEAFVWHWHDGFVGLDRAEGVVLGGDVQVREGIEGRGLAHVGQADDPHLQGVAGPTPEGHLFFLLFLFGRHACGSIL